MPAPRQIGPYEVLRPLDAGGMGHVYLARATSGPMAGRPVVVKMIRAELEGAPEHIASFKREAQLLAHLRHPNIVTLYDTGEVQGRLYIAMEYLEGLDVAKILRVLAPTGRRIPFEVVVHVALQCAQALDSAHAYTMDDGKRAGLVHRDLSPHNVFLTYAGVVKILDFGLARAEGPAATSTTGTVKGKFRYLAPEQARGEEIDERVDIFTLGLVLHEMLTGRRAYDQPGDIDALRAAMTGQFRRLGELDAGVPAPLVRVVERAVRTDAHDRYPSALALADDLAQAAKELGLLVDPHMPDAFMAELRDLAAATPPAPHAPLDQPSALDSCEVEALSESGESSASVSRATGGSGAMTSVADVALTQPPRRRVARVLLPLAVVLTAAGVTVAALEHEKITATLEQSEWLGGPATSASAPSASSAALPIAASGSPNAPESSAPSPSAALVASAASALAGANSAPPGASAVAPVVANRPTSPPRVFSPSPAFGSHPARPAPKRRRP